jgi:type VI secretion system protein ImpL
VVSYNGAASVVASQSGRMGLMRLLASAKVAQDSSDLVQLSWPVGKATDGQMVRFNFRMVGGVNPLQLIKLLQTKPA